MGQTTDDKIAVAVDDAISKKSQLDFATRIANLEYVMDEKISHAIDNCLAKQPRADLSKWISILITLITLTVGTVVWAYGQTNEIKDWTSHQNSLIKEEIEGRMDKHFVPKSEFTRVEQKLNDQREDIQEIKGKLDKLLELNSTPSRSRNDR